MRFLISMEADIEAKDALERTPLLAGLQNECYDAVKVLIEYNANIFSDDSEGENAFNYACKNNITNLILTAQTIKQKDVNKNTA